MARQQKWVNKKKLQVGQFSKDYCKRGTEQCPPGIVPSQKITLFWRGWNNSLLFSIMQCIIGIVPSFSQTMQCIIVHNLQLVCIFYKLIQDNCIFLHEINLLNVLYHNIYFCWFPFKFFTLKIRNMSTILHPYLHPSMSVSEFCSYTNSVTLPSAFI